MHQNSKKSDVSSLHYLVITFSSSTKT